MSSNELTISWNELTFFVERNNSSLERSDYGTNLPDTKYTGRLEIFKSKSVVIVKKNKKNKVSFFAN